MSTYTLRSGIYRSVHHGQAGTGESSRPRRGARGYVEGVGAGVATVVVAGATAGEVGTRTSM